MKIIETKIFKTLFKYPKTNQKRYGEGGLRLSNNLKQKKINH